MSVGMHFLRLTLADLRRVLPMTARHVPPTPPPSSRPCAGIFAPHYWACRCGSSLIPAEDVVAPRSCLLYARWNIEAVRTAGTSSPATTLPFWSWRLSPLRHMGLTTLQTQVPCVSIGHRVSPLSPSLDYSRTPLCYLRVQRECYSLAHEDHFLGHYSTRYASRTHS